MLFIGQHNVRNDLIIVFNIVLIWMISNQLNFCVWTEEALEK